VPLSTRDDLCSLLLTALDVTHDSVVLHLRDLRSLVRVRGERVSDLELLSLCFEASHKLVVDGSLNVDTRTGAACLTVVEAGSQRMSTLLITHSQDSLGGILDSGLKVGVLEDDV
jgi:hypothetical protein